MFASHFGKFFKKIVKKSQRSSFIGILVILKDVVMTTLHESTGPQFSLSEIFQVELGNKEIMKVIFDKQRSSDWIALPQFAILFGDSSGVLPCFCHLLCKEWH